MSGGGKRAKKEAYAQKLIELVDNHRKILLASVDNVSSSQMQKIRMALRGQATVLMGKNTMIRRALREHLKNNPKIEGILPFVKGNVGLIFINDDVSIKTIKDVIQENRVAAPAKAGADAPNDVIVPAGPTGMEPTMTSFLQALNIASKINRGQVEIIADVHLIKTGQRVGQSEANLLQRLGIMPFTYGLTLEQVYDDGFVFSAELLELSDDDVVASFVGAIQNVAKAALSSGTASVASVPHLVARAYANLVFASLATDYTFKGTEEFKAYLENPEAFADRLKAAPATGGDGGDDKKDEAAADAGGDDAESDSEDFAGGGLFGDDDDDDW